MKNEVRLIGIGHQTTKIEVHRHLHPKLRCFGKLGRHGLQLSITKASPRPSEAFPIASSRQSSSDEVAQSHHLEPFNHRFHRHRAYECLNTLVH